MIILITINNNNNNIVKFDINKGQKLREDGIDEIEGHVKMKRDNCEQMVIDEVRWNELEIIKIRVR